MSESAVVSPGRGSLLRNIARAAFTVPPFLVQHLWRRRRVDDVTRTVDVFSEHAPENGPSDDVVQRAQDGSGPLVMRTYEVSIENARLAPEALMRRLLDRPGDLNDDRIAGFVRDDAPATDLDVGDDLVVELPGPWNGPVRVLEADSTVLLLQTLEGHMEAGKIRFDTLDHHSGPDATHGFVFRIRSWARGGDQAFTILHLGVRAAKELQTAMWVAMCDGAVDVSRGERVGKIRVSTEVLADSAPPDDPLGEVLEKTGGH